MSLKTLWILCCIIFLVDAQNWRGHIERYTYWAFDNCSRCTTQYNWGCGHWKYFRCYNLRISFVCASGWTHRGDYNCDVPICYPNCRRGQCIAPNTCDCKNLATGKYCETLITSPRNHVTLDSVSTTANATAAPDVRNSTQL